MKRESYDSIHLVIKKYHGKWKRTLYMYVVFSVCKIGQNKRYLKKKNYYVNILFIELLFSFICRSF